MIFLATFKAEMYLHNFDTFKQYLFLALCTNKTGSIASVEFLTAIDTKHHFFPVHMVKICRWYKRWKAKYQYHTIESTIWKSKLQCPNVRSPVTIAAMYRLRIREEAEKQGYNQSSLSRASNISYVTIKKIWRNPAYEINVVTLHKIAQTLGVTTSDLIEDIPDTQKT